MPGPGETCGSGDSYSPEECSGRGAQPGCQPQPRSPQRQIGGHAARGTTSTRGATGSSTPYGEDPTLGGGAGIMMTCGEATAGRGATPYWSCPTTGGG